MRDHGRQSYSRLCLLGSTPQPCCRQWCFTRRPAARPGTRPRAPAPRAGLLAARRFR
jgi:hypothetical protein